MREEHRRKVTQITRSHTHSGTHYGASRSDRSAFGYWIPLALTLTAATVGIVAWVWSERGDEDSESEPEHYYANAARPGSQRPGSQYPGSRDDPRASGPPPGSFGGDAAGAAAAAGLGAAAGYASMSGRQQSGPAYPGGPPSQGGFAPGSQGGFVPGPPSQGGFQGPPPGAPMVGPSGAAESYFREGQSRDISSAPVQQEDTSFLGRMSSALGMTRGGTPGRTNFSGGGWASGALAAAGSMVEGAVNSVRGSGENFEETRDRNVSASATGEQKTHFSDQEKWSEEADKPERRDTMSPRKSQQSFGSAAAAGLGAAALGSIAAGGSRSGSRPGSRAGSTVQQASARESFVDTRGSNMDVNSTRGSVMEHGSTRGSARDLGSKSGSTMDVSYRESGVDRSLSGTAAEFYSGAVEVPRRSSATHLNRKTIAIVVSSLEKGDGSTEVDMHQVSFPFPQPK